MNIPNLRLFEPCVNNMLTATSSTKREGLFSNISFYLHPSDDSPKETEKLITEHDGNIVDTPELATYVISNSFSTCNLDKFDVISNDWITTCILYQAILPIEPYLVGKEKLFNSVVFCLGEDFTQTDRENIFSMLTYYGACYNESLKECTHHITLGNEKHTFYYDRQKHIQPTIKVVSPQWVVDSIKSNKPLPESNYKYTPDPSQLRLVIPTFEMQDSQNTPNDISSPVLKIITSPIVPREVTNHTTPDLSYPIITHDNITEYTPTRMFSSQISQDSIRSMSTSPYHNYPQIITPTFTKLSDMFNEKSPSIIITPHTPEPAADIHTDSIASQTQTQTNTHTQQGKSSNDTERTTREKIPLLYKAILFFDGFIELIGRDAQKEWEKIVTLHGGFVSPIYNDKVTHVILRHAMCDAYTKALRDRKFIASAYWLNDILLKEQLFSPCCPLHIPIKNPKPKDMAGLLISASNFEGAERATLKDMTSLLGANYTSYLSKKHDFLITNKAQGIKYTKAKEWNIPIVNARYLVDALFQPGLPDRIKNIYRNIELGNRLEINNIDYLKPLLSVWTQHLP
ncbi:hypothetical protein LOD99_2622 [Oopsacas minuta]|uniref:BRCT domain-containing protein n=1 Tax=Oopsacas minuta TaxID=111878 RepID=A0AAV7K1C0_9METZ|nr:hypothetical protein LOD99_2622 [Oopsacas minuta]